MLTVLSPQLQLPNQSTPNTGCYVASQRHHRHSNHSSDHKTHSSSNNNNDNSTMERPQLMRVTSTEYSELSMTLDDIADPRETHRSRGGFTLSCWETQSDDIFEGNESETEENSDESESEFYIQQPSSKCNPNLIISSTTTRPQDSTPESQTSPRSCYEQPSSGMQDERKVRFDFCLDIHEIDRVQISDYPLLYYGANELQQIMDDFKTEERRKGRVVTLPRDS